MFYSTGLFILIISLLGVVSHAYNLAIDIEDKPMHGPRQDPKRVEEVWGSMDEWKRGDALVILTDNNFEHLTQATSGATTGDWFVMFGAKWCQHCEDMMLNWNQTARELKGEINVAYMDASNSPFTSLRLNITAYPTLLFLRRGLAYEYKGPRYWKDLARFARLDYEDAPSFTIPPAHGTFDEMVYSMQQYSGRLYAVYENDPKTFWGAILFGAVFGCLLPYGYILCAEMDPTFMTAKSTEYKGPAVWTKNSEKGDIQEQASSTSNLPEVSPNKTEKTISVDVSESNVEVKETDVDKEPVEVVSNASSKPGARKNKNKHRKGQ